MYKIAVKILNWKIVKKMRTSTSKEDVIKRYDVSRQPSILFGIFDKTISDGIIEIMREMDRYGFLTENTTLLDLAEYAARDHFEEERKVTLADQEKRNS